MATIKGMYSNKTTMYVNTLEEVANVIESYIPLRYCKICHRVIDKNEDEEKCCKCLKTSIFRYRNLGNCSICITKMKFGIYQFPCGHRFHIHCCESLPIKESTEDNSYKVYVECPNCRHKQNYIEFKLNIC